MTRPGREEEGNEGIERSGGDVAKAHPIDAGRRGGYRRQDGREQETGGRAARTKQYDPERRAEKE